MTARVQHYRLTTTNTSPAVSARPTGELWFNYPDQRIGFIDSAKVPQDLLGVRRHAATATYATGDFATQGGQMWRSKGVLAPKVFAAGDWNQVITAAGGTVTGPLIYTATGGTAARSAQARAADWLNPKDYGAVGDGVANDTAAVQAVLALNRPIYAPSGTYKTTIAQNQLFGGVWLGPGQIMDADNNKRGPILNVVDYVPTSGNWDNLLTAFNGDLSSVPFAIEHRIQGAATLGQPTSGYTVTPETAAFAEFFYNASGHNASTSTNAGRTGAVLHYTQAFQAGQGDIIPYFVSTFVSGTKAGSTDFLANPAGTILAGATAAGTAGVLLQGIGDINLIDNGFDVAAFGITMNFSRGNTAGAVGATWVGERLQSIGTASIDAFWSCAGPTTIGMDMVGMATGNAAVTLRAGLRIYGNATNGHLTRFPRYTAPGTEWISYEPATGWNVVVGGAARLKVTSAGIDAGNGAITTLGSINAGSGTISTFGAITGGSLSAGGGAITGGHLTVSSLSVNAADDGKVKITNTLTVDQLAVAGDTQMNFNLTVFGTASKPGGGVWAATSDARVKTVLGSYELGLPELLKLKPVRYQFKGNDEANGQRMHQFDLDRVRVGLVAQDVEVAWPSMVTQVPGFIDGEPVNDLRILDPSELTFAMINALRQLAERVADLEEEV